ncbi:hypothetical protein [Streptomyces beigongshangae]|uniref:hypothetical protein n=1 Tax=Streptomyces beigongshangae TaxID=2841597 RepID=UPI001C848DFB|nr:hypothetical protein [Streptomyces sp. REN17]
MRRGTTLRALFTALAAVLLALQLSAPTTAFAATFATAYAAPLPGSQAEFATCAETTHPHGPAGPLRTRDRVRTADHVPPASARPPLCGDVSVRHEDPSHVSAAAAHHRTTRSCAGRSTAALQVFRC